MPSPEEARRLLCELGDHVRGLVVGARGIDMAVIEGQTSADTIYAIDKIADDALWGIRMPYVLAVHQAPVGQHPHYPFHVELHPPLRAPGLMKYLAGPEIGGGSMTNETDPDEKAAELRDALS